MGRTKKRTYEEELLQEMMADNSLKETEKHMRMLGSLCSQFNLTYRITRYPLANMFKNWKIEIIRFEPNDKKILIFESYDSECKALLEYTIRWIKNYRLKNKEYDISIQGREFI